MTSLGKKNGRTLHNTHAVNLRAHPPWWMCLSLGSDRDLTLMSISDSAPKNMKFPKETRYTACAPNHCGDGSMLNVDIPKVGTRRDVRAAAAAGEVRGKEGEKVVRRKRKKKKRKRNKNKTKTKNNKKKYRRRNKKKKQERGFDDGG